MHSVAHLLLPGRELLIALQPAPAIQVAGASFLNRTRLYAAAPIANACCSFQRPTIRHRSKPPITFSQPKHSSTFLRHF
jgi:hypothetical protein